jgi:hypothetical protein
VLASAVTDAGDAGAEFPELSVYWSPTNIGAGNGESDAEIALGQIRHQPLPGARQGQGTGYQLYLLGKPDNDTDENDSHVIAHEFGHYLQAAFSRDDSAGGTHEDGDVLDIRVAFSEGWGNGWGPAASAAITAILATQASTTPVFQLFDNTGVNAESKDDGVDTARQ